VIEKEGGGSPVRRAETGETGMFLVRGKSIFSGYLTKQGEPLPDPFMDFEGEKGTVRATFSSWMKPAG
jgi:hypothetical protein